MRHKLEFGAFEIDSLPGNSQIAMCHHFMVLNQYRGKGRGRELKEYQEQVLEQMHYGYAIATVAAHNIPQIKIMEATGWKRLDTFYNVRHGEMTIIWGKHLKDGQSAPQLQPPQPPQPPQPT